MDLNGRNSRRKAELEWSLYLVCPFLCERDFSRFWVNFCDELVCFGIQSDFFAEVIIFPLDRGNVRFERIIFHFFFNLFAFCPRKGGKKKGRGRQKIGPEVVSLSLKGDGSFIDI
jgi:hypothetical protein